MAARECLNEGSSTSGEEEDLSFSCEWSDEESDGLCESHGEECLGAVADMQLVRPYSMEPVAKAASPGPGPGTQPHSPAPAPDQQRLLNLDW